MRPVCECGDWQSDHIFSIGACLVCRWSNAGPPPCRVYVYSHDEKPSAWAS